MNYRSNKYQDSRTINQSASPESTEVGSTSNHHWISDVHASAIPPNQTDQHISNLSHSSPLHWDMEPYIDPSTLRKSSSYFRTPMYCSWESRPLFMNQSSSSISSRFFFLTKRLALKTTTSKNHAHRGRSGSLFLLDEVPLVVAPDVLVRDGCDWSLRCVFVDERLSVCERGKAIVVSGRCGA